MFSEFDGQKFNIIYADPAWVYKDKANSGNRGAGHKYNLSSLSDLMQMPINQIAADDCVLFMWWVPPMPLEALKLVEAWGFKLKTMKGFTWHKLNKRALTSFLGMGNWSRANTEDCLIAVKGNIKRVDASVRQFVESPIREHSRKPDEVRDRIVQLMGDIPRIELFSRQDYPGWSSFGDQSSKFNKLSEVSL
jgi:N6-adenosine-specific RNA methylase IME4